MAAEERRRQAAAAASASSGGSGVGDIGDVGRQPRAATQRGKQVRRAEEEHWSKTESRIRSRVHTQLSLVKGERKV